jgi:DNA (cytosine-5)-methyltransferase 1
MKAFYNDIEKYACEWMQNLIFEGELSDGLIFQGSIKDLNPEALNGFERAHFFAGIGGWEYALNLAGWPADLPVWTGSCPCQPFSVAGKRKGEDDVRHLWPDFKKLIERHKPPVIFGEQVASKDGRDWLSGVRADLETLGYEVGAADLCAAGVGAPHIRQRLYWVAVSRSQLERWCIQRSAESTLAFDQWASDQFGGSSDSRGLDLSYSQGRQFDPQRDGDALRRIDPSYRPDAYGSGNARRMANTESSERERSGDSRERRTGSADSGGLGHTNIARSQGRRFDAGEHADKRTAWTPSESVLCADGKTRRFESGSFPLANGVPSRVGRLRAYGNAIVPQVAEQFIRSVMDVFRISGGDVCRP